MAEHITRRHALKTGLALAATTILVSESPQELYTSEAMIRPQILGFNFSPVQCDYLGLGPVFDVYRSAMDLDPEYLRLTTYPTRPSEETHQLLQEAKDRGIKVILAVGGIKYPRWPEFYYDEELKIYVEKNNPRILGEDEYTYQKAIARLNHNLEEFNIYPNITHLQGGNESSNNVAVANGIIEAPRLIKEELRIVNQKKKAGQQSMTTFSFPLGVFPFMPNPDKQIMLRNAQLVDTVGIHFYSKVPHRLLGYLTAGKSDFDRAEAWNNEVSPKVNEVWATEVQAEPFEPNQLIHIKNRTYPSSNPERMIDLVGELTRRGFNRQLLWGVEHWLWHQKEGHDEWIKAWRNLQNAPLLQAA